MKKYSKCMFSIVIIVILFVCIKGEFSFILLHNANYGIPALIQRGEVDNLYIGSSMFRQGIDIMELEENGEKNYILAYNGNQPLLEYYQLKELIYNNVQVETLYIDMYVYSAWASPKISDEKMLMEFGLKDKWELWKLISSGDYVEDIKLFWQMFVTGNNELLAMWPLSGKVINGIFYKGGSLNKPVASDKSVLDTTAVPQANGIMNSLQKEYSIKLIQLAKENEIKLIYIETPKYYNMANDPGYINAMEQYIDFLDSEGVEYILCDTTWRLTGEKGDYYLYDNAESAYYVDNGHLSYEGRLEFTKKIINYN